MAKKRKAAKRTSAANLASKRQADAFAPRPRSPKARKHVPTRGLRGWITHTDFASLDPAATKNWCVDMFGWKFQPSFKLPDGGEYHLFAYSEQGGGGIGRASAVPGSLPFVHVADTNAAFRRALAAGAAQVMAPNRVIEGVTIAIVRAPGGVAIGLSGP